MTGPNSQLGRLSLEMGSIVFAVVFGFAVTNWDEGRRDRAPAGRGQLTDHGCPAGGRAAESRAVRACRPTSRVRPLAPSELTFRDAAPPDLPTRAGLLAHKLGGDA
jgi:hypothetical protein